MGLVKWVCRVCGSSEVDVIAWVDANTLEYSSGYADEDKDPEDTYCKVCEDRTGIVDIADYKTTES